MANTAEAFAYIIPATFLAAIVSRISSIARFADLEWVLVGLAAALATFPWIHAGARFGKARSLELALGIQAVGMVAPILSGGVLPIVIAALTLGGTFMAITLFATGWRAKYSRSERALRSAASPYSTAWDR